ncbi:MAG: MiaB/RimO family radical SAM methylthiotransferase [Parcubacteria group bacterium]|nr:MiaB/RimO family radical SAM methylthiotransferase [Parcubacteria group bacterium]
MKTYHIITIGCQMNKSDSERLAGRLEQNGYKKTDNKYQADLIVVNTCGVRQSAEDRIYGLIPGIKKANQKAKIVLTGCLAARQDVKNRLKDYVDEWLPISEIFNFQFSIFKQTLIFNFQANAKCKNDYLKIIPKYESEFSAFVPIGNGCNNFCSYCVVPYARGREVYRPVEDILAEVKELVKKNYKEIILIAQNVNSYKSQIPNPNNQTNSKSQIKNSKNKIIDFSDLLKMVNGIQGDFWLRFMTSHPKDMSDKLIETMVDCEKVCHQVHLPAQAGDDEVLASMNRKYKIADYVELVGKIRSILNDQIPITNNQTNSKFQVPNSKQSLWKQPVSITTDLIVGFPTETKRRFANTAKLMRQIKFDMAYIAKYSARPETAAAKMQDNVSTVEKKRREQILMKILRKTALENNKKYLGKIMKVLVEGESKSEEWAGRTATNKNVKFPSASWRTNDKNNLIGKFVNVKIIKAQDFGLAGELIS